jgi:hypothetical protein
MPNAEYCRAKKEAGICLECNRPVLNGYVRCAFHHEKNIEAHRRYYQRNHAKMIKKKAMEQKRAKAEHRCVHCFNRMYTDGNECPDCIAYNSARG